MSHPGLVGVLLLGLTTLASPLLIAAEPPPPLGAPAKQEAEQRILQALEKPVTVDFKEMPLEGVLAFLEDLAKIPIMLDRVGLEKAKIEPGTRISLQVSKVSLRSALQLLLRNVDLVYTIQDEVLLVTSPERVAKELSTRVYPVADMAIWGPSSGKTACDLEALSQLIKQTLQPATWDEVVGPGSIVPAEFVGVKALVVRQTCEAHKEIAALLATLQTVAEQVAKGDTTPRMLPPWSPDKETIQRALMREVTFEFAETPLKEALAQLKKQAGVNIVIDTKALEDVEIKPDVPITGQGNKISLRSALRRLLRHLDLTYVIRDEVILVTTPEEGELRLDTGIYPVGDLIGRKDEKGQTVYDYQTLIQMITAIIKPTTWDDVGGPGSIKAVPCEGLHALVVSQSSDVHEQCVSLLNAIRELAKSPDNQKSERLLLRNRLGPETTSERTIRQALGTKVTLDFVGTPLVQVAEHLRQTYGINCDFDRRALDDCQVDLKTPIDFRVRDVSLRSALKLLLAPLRLTWIVEDETLLITSVEEAECTWLEMLYPVGDLVVCENDEGQLWDDYESLCRVIDTMFYPNIGDTADGSGPTLGISLGGAKVLVVGQKSDVQDEVLALLRRLREVAARSKDAKPPRRNRPAPKSTPERDQRFGGFGKGMP